MGTIRRAEELRDYENFPPTPSCYLDGRYFNIVLKELYPGIVEAPLAVSFHRTVAGYEFQMNMKEAFVSAKYPSFIRVVIQSTKMRHSALIMLDLSRKKGWYWNPRTYDVDDSGKDLDVEIFQRISNFIRETLGVHMYQHELKVPNTKNLDCDMSGYCNAYIIKFVLDWLVDASPEFNKIRSFCTMIEEEYGHKLTGKEDIEFQFGPGGLALGLGGGLLLGTALGATMF